MITDFKTFSILARFVFCADGKYLESSWRTLSRVKANTCRDKVPPRPEAYRSPKAPHPCPHSPGVFVACPIAAPTILPSSPRIPKLPTTRYLNLSPTLRGGADRVLSSWPGCCGLDTR